MKKIIYTMFGILASVPVSLVTTATASANPYPGYMPPPWVRPNVMPPRQYPVQYPVTYRAPYARPRYLPMIPYAAPRPMMRPMRPMRPVRSMRPVRPMRSMPMAQRRMPAAPTRQFAYNPGRAPLSVPRYATGPVPMPAPVHAWGPGRPGARQMPPARHFYPGQAQFRPQYRFARAPARLPGYFQSPAMYNNPRRLTRAPVPVQAPRWRAPVAQYRPVVPPRQTVWRAGPTRSMPSGRMHAWPPQYARQSAPPRQGYRANRFRQFPSASTQSVQPAYGTRQVSYAYGR